MATHSSILAWRIPMDRGAWRGTVHGGHKELDMTEWLSTAHLTGMLRHPGEPLLPSLVSHCPPFLGCTLSSSRPLLSVPTWLFFTSWFKSTWLLPRHIPPFG